MLSAEKILELKLKANEIRKETVKTIASIGVGHIGGSLSIADVMAVRHDFEKTSTAKIIRRKVEEEYKNFTDLRDKSHA